jgi:hypothetical protein
MLSNTVNTGWKVTVSVSVFSRLIPVFNIVANTKNYIFRILKFVNLKGPLI